MKKLLAVATLIGSLVLSAQAQVQIYKIRCTSTCTGAYLKTIRQVTGYLVYDCATGNVTAIYAIPKQQTYKIDTDWDITVAHGPGAAEYTAYTQGSTTYDGNGNANVNITVFKGLNSMVDIGDTKSLWRIPRTLTIMGRATYPSASGQMCIEEDAGTLTLDLKNTKYYNSVPFTAQATINLLLTEYAGWTQKKGRLSD